MRELSSTKRHYSVKAPDGTVWDFNNTDRLLCNAEQFSTSDAITTLQLQNGHALISDKRKNVAKWSFDIVTNQLGVGKFFSQQGKFTLLFTREGEQAQRDMVISSISRSERNGKGYMYHVEVVFTSPFIQEYIPVSRFDYINIYSVQQACPMFLEPQQNVDKFAIDGYLMMLGKAGTYSGQCQRLAFNDESFTVTNYAPLDFTNTNILETYYMYSTPSAYNGEVYKASLDLSTGELLYTTIISDSGYLIQLINILPYISDINATRIRFGISSNGLTDYLGIFLIGTDTQDMQVTKVLYITKNRSTGSVVIRTNTNDAVRTFITSSVAKFATGTTPSYASHSTFSAWSNDGDIELLSYSSGGTKYQYDDTMATYPDNQIVSLGGRFIYQNNNPENSGVSSATVSGNGGIYAQDYKIGASRPYTFILFSANQVLFKGMNNVAANARGSNIDIIDYGVCGNFYPYNTNGLLIDFATDETSLKVYSEITFSDEIIIPEYSENSIGAVYTCTVDAPSTTAQTISITNQDTGGLFSLTGIFNTDDAVTITNDGIGISVLYGSADITSWIDQSTNWLLTLNPGINDIEVSGCTIESVVARIERAIV